MNNHLIILGIAVLLLAVGLSGCNEENTIQDGSIDIEKMILGSWKWIETITTIDGNTTFDSSIKNLTLTFFDNGTYKIEESDIWGDYEIKNNEIWASQRGYSANRYDIGISSDGKNLNFSHIGDYPDGRTQKTIERYIRLE